jgi:hypothetical protein
MARSAHGPSAPARCGPRVNAALGIWNRGSQRMNVNLIWGPVRSLLRERCTSYRAHLILSRAGFDITTIAGIPLTDQTTDKNALFTRVDDVFGSLEAGEKQRFVTAVTEEILTEKPELQQDLERYLRRLGWKLHERTIVPVEVFDVADLPLLPAAAATDLVKAAERARDGDLTGAVTAACGAVDTVTSAIWQEYELGDLGPESFQKGVAESLRAKKAYVRLKEELMVLGWAEKDADVFVDNTMRALNAGAYVLQKLRSDMGDVHGSHPVIESVVYDAVKWATLTLRLLSI